MSRMHRFGSFELRVTERLLLRDGKPLTVGARALDLLIALVEAAGSRLSKADLMARVWPGMVVEEANVHVQVSLLRKLLGAQAIGTVAGLGYQFTLPLDRGPARHHLPEEQTAFIGRDAALIEAQSLLKGNRLLTLIGMGGSGKTRLALRLAQQSLSDPIDVVAWVNLAPLEAPDQLLAAVAQAVGFQLRSASPALEMLAAHLQGLRCLLLLDNCETLLDPVASMVDLLLGSVPGLCVLATSREPLSLPGETVLAVGPMDLPPPGAGDVEVLQAEAVRLFVQGASTACTGWSPAEGETAVVADICRRLDGIPLAIELAAAQLRVITTRQLAELLSQRFRVLVGNRRALRRHDTLAMVIQWSYDHLQRAEQRLLACIGVCAGGCDLEAAAAIMGSEVQPVDLLAGLVRLSNLSLLTVRPSAKASRYDLLDTVRQFTLERQQDKGALSPLRDCHAQHYLALAESAFADIAAHGEGEVVLRKLDLERENLLRALDWWISDGGLPAKVLALRLVASLRYYWPSRGLVKLGIRVTTAAVDPAWAVPFTGHHTEAVAGLVQMLAQTGECSGAATLATRLLDFAGSGAADTDRLSICLLLGEVECTAGRFDESRTHFHEARALARRLGQTRREIGALSGLSRVAASTGQHEEAGRLQEEVLVLRRADGHGYNLMVALLNTASLALGRSDHVSASASLAEAAALAPRVGSDYLVMLLLTESAQLLASRTHWAATVEMLAAAHPLQLAQSYQFDDAEKAQQRGALERARAALGATAFDAAWQAGQSWTAASGPDRVASCLAMPSACAYRSPG